MIKYELITVDGAVIYCDGCRKRGREEADDSIKAGDSTNNMFAQAERDGWDLEDGEFCPECALKKKEKKNS